MLPLDDKTLIEACQAGDELAFVALYNRYKGPVYVFCTKMLLDRELAQDAMQETFLKVYEHRAELARTTAFRSWLFTIARNHCLNLLKQLQREVELDEEVLPADALVEAPGEHMEKSEAVAWVNTFLGQLKPDYREVLVLREYQNLSYEEIAVITRTTLAGVKARLFKARRRLAEVMLPLWSWDRSQPVSQGRSTEPGAP
jgi:RNA polymerase sigma-70 factor (ECF subfamily)